MARCDICGTEFDPLGFQVVVPELAAGFDRIECARQARQLAPAGTPPAILPLAAIAEPVPAFAGAALPLAVHGDSGPALGAAALGLLAAATAASVFLWLRILGADPSGFSLPGSLAPSAVERRAVAAEIVAAPESRGAPVTRRETASAGSSGGGVLAAPTSAFAAPVVAGGPLRIGTAPTRRSGEPATRTSDSSVRKGPAGATRHGAGKAPANAAARVPPGRASGNGHGNDHGHAQGHGHGQGKKIGHSKHG